MSDFALGAAARTSLTALQSISDQETVVQKRLATGKRVNSAVDGPAAFFTASALLSRAATLTGLLDNIGTAQQTIDAANDGITAIKSLLASAKSLATQALQSPDTLVTVTGTNSTALTAATQIASTAGSATLFQAGDQLTVSDGTTTATFTAADGDTVQTFLDAINNTANLKVEASLNSSGQIVLSATDTVDVTVGATVNGSGTLNSVIGLSAGTTDFETNTTRQSLAEQFGSLLDQIDQVAQDASFNGTNLLTGGSLSVTFNETGTSSLSIAGGNFQSADLGLSSSVGDFQRDSDINGATDAIDSAITTVRAQSSVFASNAAIISTRQHFTTSMVNTLTTGADDLTASDVNEDVAMLLALQTRQQMVVTMFSLTQSDAQGALRLLGA